MKVESIEYIHRLLTDADYYRQAEKAMAEELYKEFQKGE